jgi:hypothetical protein
MRLTQRDTDVLESIYSYRYLSISQVQRLHFPSEQTTNRRVRLLADAGYIEDFHVPGIRERLVALKRKGADVVAERLRVAQEKLGWKKRARTPTDTYFLQHFLSVNDFRITLVEACIRHEDLQLLGFIPEYLGTRTAKGGVRKHIQDVVSGISSSAAKVTHTPDGVFALQKEGKTALFFLEWDRGTETIGRVIDMAHFFAAYLVGGGYRRYEEEFEVSQPFRGFRTLIVTTSKRRLQNIRQAGGKIEPVEAQRFLWITTTDRLGELLDPIWVSLDPGDHQYYAINGRGR